MEIASHITFSALADQILVGLSRTTILFIVSSGMSLVLGVLRIPNLAHGSLYMIGAFWHIPLVCSSEVPPGSGLL